MDDERAPSDDDSEQDETSSSVIWLNRLGWVFLFILALICSGAVLLPWLGFEESIVYSGVFLWTAGIYFMYLIWATSFPVECSPRVHLISCVMFAFTGCLSLIKPTAVYGRSELVVTGTLSIGYCWWAILFYFSGKMSRLVIQRENEGDPEKLLGLSLESLRISVIGFFLMAFFLIQGTNGVKLSIMARSEYTRHSPYCSYSEESLTYDGGNCWNQYDFLDVPFFTSNTTFISYEKASQRKKMLDDDLSNIIGNISTNSTEYFTVHDLGRIDSVLMRYKAGLYIVSGWGGGQIIVGSLFAYDVFVQVGHIAIEDLFHLAITRGEAIWVMSSLTGVFLLVVIHALPGFFKEYQYALISGFYFTFFLCGTMLVTEARSVLVGKHLFYDKRLVKKQADALLSPAELEMMISLLRASQARRQSQARQYQNLIHEMREKLTVQSVTISRLQAKYQ